MNQPRTVCRIALLGTGIMGAPMARHLGAAGYRVAVYNRTPAKAEALAGEPGITVAATVADAVRDAQAIVTMVKDAAAVEELLTQPGVEFARDAVLVQMGTVGIEGTRRVGEMARRLGVRLVDAPVLGTKGPAEQAQLLVLASGPQELQPGLAPLFEAVGRQTLWLSEVPGDASKLKLAFNAFINAVTHGIAESVRLAEAMQIDPRWLSQALADGPLDSPFARMKLAATLARDFTPNFALDNAAKDTRLVLDAARETGAWTPLAAAGLARYDAATAAGHGAEDMAASYFADAT